MPLFRTASSFATPCGRRRPWIRAASGLALCACEQAAPPRPATASPTVDFAVACTVESKIELPGILRETSGLALSAAHPGVLWTINDSGGGPLLFAIDTTGALIATVRVAGAQNLDWEDLALAPCPEGSCLFIADVGDNFERRNHVTIYKVPEPSLSATATAPAVPIRFVYPDRPRNVEAVAVSPDGYALVIAKWGDHAIYAVPITLTTDVVQATLLQRLQGADDLSGASLTPDGRWLVIRGYGHMRFFGRNRNGTFYLVGDPLGIDLRPLRERGGEAVAIRSDGTIFLSSEGTSRRRPLLSRLNCALP